MWEEGVCSHAAPSRPPCGLSVQTPRRVQVAVRCSQELFRSDVENADDLRINWRLFQSCSGEVGAFCSASALSGGAVQVCLEKHRYKPTFSEHCRCATVVNATSPASLCSRACQWLTCRCGCHVALRLDTVLSIYLSVAKQAALLLQVPALRLVASTVVELPVSLAADLKLCLSAPALLKQPTA